MDNLSGYLLFLSCIVHAVLVFPKTKQTTQHIPLPARGYERTLRVSPAAPKWDPRVDGEGGCKVCLCVCLLDLLLCWFRCSTIQMDSAHIFAHRFLLQPEGITDGRLYRFSETSDTQAKWRATCCIQAGVDFPRNRVHARMFHQVE